MGAVLARGRGPEGLARRLKEAEIGIMDEKLGYFMVCCTMCWLAHLACLTVENIDASHAVSNVVAQHRVADERGRVGDRVCGAARGSAGQRAGVGYPYRRRGG